MKKKFEFKFEDYPHKNGISFDFSEEMDEAMAITVENDVPVLCANRTAYLLLAKAFIKIAMGEYDSGFRFHLNQDFDSDEPEAIRCHLVEEA